MKKQKSNIKRLTKELIPLEESEGVLNEPHRLLNDLIANVPEHSKLAELTFCLVWKYEAKPDRDGLIQPNWVKVLDEVRRLKGEEVEITLNADWWNHPNTTLDQRRYCLDDALSQIRIQEDAETGEEKQDEKGRYLLRKAKHDVVAFSAVEERHPSGTNVGMRRLLIVMATKRRVEFGDRYGLDDLEDEEPNTQDEVEGVLRIS